MTRTVPATQRLVIGLFLFLAAVAAAVAPLPLLFRSLGILLASYLAFAAAGMPAAYLTSLLAPPLGLIRGEIDWLVMLPLILSSNLLAMLGLEYAWRFPALVISPLLAAVPLLFVMLTSRQDLFSITLPWEPNPLLWIGLHALVAAAGVLAALMLERQRTRSR